MSVYHPGERQVQARAQEVAAAAANGRVIASTILPGARPFIARQTFIAVASVAADGSPWASLLVGSPGFLTADERALAIHLAQVHRDDRDPLWRHLEEDPRLGVVVIELGSRRRYRINGTVQRDATVLRCAVVEAYPNCPKFIHRRIPHLGSPRPVDEVSSFTALTDDDRAAIVRADTAFVASVVPGGMPDASHRGGRPGFLEVLPDGRVRLPDYPGNSMFNTWGNLAVDPRASLVVPDFASGRVLQIAGPADLQWDQPDPEGRTAGTGRFWTIQPTRIRVATLPVDITWETLEASPFSPTWG